MLGDYRDILTLNLSSTFVLKNFEEILGCIDDDLRHKENLKQN